MTRRNNEAELSEQIASHLLAESANSRGQAPDPQLIADLESMPDAIRRRVLQRLLENLSELKQGVDRRDAALEETAEHMQKLKQIIAKLTSPPWYPAVFVEKLLVQPQQADAPPVAMASVHVHGGSRRIVGFADGMDPDCLQAGSDVLLSAEQNVIMQPSPADCLYTGELAVFDRLAADGQRIILRVREEEIIVRPVGTLVEDPPKSGDLVRWERAMGLAFEKFERSQGDSLFLEDTPRETFADIGGLDDAIEQIRNHLTMKMRFPETAQQFDYEPARSILLVGPPGTGKTMLAKAVANFLGHNSKSGRSRFINVKPGGLNSMWYGQTEANYREVFRVARMAAEAEPDSIICMFFDEIDSVATTRGSYISNTTDRVLPAFMAELNGLEDRGNILVVAATNRLDMLDTAVVREERLGDLIIEVPRPGRDAAREIMKRYFRESLPYAHRGEGPAKAREELIEVALASIYAPNGNGDLAIVKFREGQQVPVRPTDLVSGALIAGVAKEAKYSAAVRAIRSGEVGIRIEDVLCALRKHYESFAAGLTVNNCRQRLDRLPSEGIILDVERVRRQVAHPIQFMNVA